METAENRRDFSANQRPNETKTEKYLPFAGPSTQQSLMIQQEQCQCRGGTASWPWRKSE